MEHWNGLVVLAFSGWGNRTRSGTMKSFLVVVTAIGLGLSSSVALAQEAGFGGEPNASKNQVPAPGLSNPADPQAGNPGSAAQVPTAPQKQEDLYDSGATGTASGETGSEELSKPQTSDPAQ
jgi:hypothetical protein